MNNESQVNLHFSNMLHPITSLNFYLAKLLL